MKKTNTAYILYVVLFYAFILRDFVEQYVAVFSYFDELFAILAIPFALYNLLKNSGHIAKKKDSYALWLVLFVAIGLSGNLLYKYQPFFTIALPDMFLCVKFFLAVYTGVCLFKNINLHKHAQNLYFHICLTALIFLLFVAAGVFQGGPSEGDIRYGIGSVSLFYRHSTIFAAVCAFLLANIMAIYQYIKSSRSVILVSALLVVLMCLSLRSKAFAEAVCFILIFFIIFIFRREVKFKFLILLIPLIALIAWNQIEYYFIMNGDVSARNQLLVQSLNVAKDHFPLGSGFGTYGSFFSSVDYSPLYAKYNLTNIYGLSVIGPNFISDMYWPMILGQTGWMGLALILLILAKLFMQIQSLSVLNSSYYASAVFIFFYMLIESTAGSAFVHASSVMFAMMLGILFSQHKSLSTRG